MASIVAVNLSEKKGTYKHPVDSIELKVDHGIVGDAHAGAWHRQVSLLGQESVDKMTALGVKDLTPGKFAENITTEGICLYTLPIRTRMRLGTALAEVTQIGKECHQHCQIYKQVGMCIMPTEGIFVKIIEPGVAKAGDSIEIVSLPIRVAVLIASDKGFSGERPDKCIPVITELLKDRATVVRAEILPDDRTQIANWLAEVSDSRTVDIILTSGGTGFAPRDFTPQATLDVIELSAPGIPEAMRARSMQATDRAMLSRAAAGIRARTLIINLPGSPKAVTECLEVFLPVMAHAVETLRGDAYECGLADGSLADGSLADGAVV